MHSILLVLTARWLLLFTFYKWSFPQLGTYGEFPSPSWASTACPTFAEASDESYTVPKDTAGEEWTYNKALSLVLLGITHQEKERGHLSEVQQLQNWEDTLRDPFYMDKRC